MLNKFIFFRHQDMITPIALNEEQVEIIIKKLIDEGFYLSHLQIFAIDYHEALDKYQLAMDMYGQQSCAEIAKTQIL